MEAIYELDTPTQKQIIEEYVNRHKIGVGSIFMETRSYPHPVDKSKRIIKLEIDKNLISDVIHADSIIPSGSDDIPAEDYKRAWVLYNDVAKGKRREQVLAKQINEHLKSLSFWQRTKLVLFGVR